MDLRAAQEALIPRHGSAQIPTGFRVAIPAGHEGQVRGRSGLAWRHAVSITHGVGTIDEDFRGEIFILLTNHGRAPFRIQRGDRIAQLIVTPVRQVGVREVDRLDNTPRGQSGYGSTGQR